jgi:hypothetical protein
MSKKTPTKKGVPPTFDFAPIDYDASVVPFGNSGLQVLGRMSDGGVDPRAPTELTHSVEVNYCSGAIGVVRAEFYRSLDNEDRGGCVIRIKIDDHASSFVPHAVSCPDGVELHMAGEAEGRAMLEALRLLISQARLP